MNIELPLLHIEQQAAQLLMPSLHPHRYATDEAYRIMISDLVESGVGGFCIFQGSMDECSQMIAELQAQADVPLLFSADFEHGLPMRLDGGTDFPHAMALGVGRDPSITKSIAAAIAREAAALGIHWNFAPVCDINTNTRNPIINTRAFGETIGDVIPQISAWIEGSQEQRVAACAKHFPGHGDCSVDSHIELPRLDLSRERLSSVELVPFLAAIRQGVRSIMVAHLSVPAFDTTGTPASLSKTLVTGVLREFMKFEGIIVTDALDMHAISSHFSSAEAVIKAIGAGCDIALVPDNPIEALIALRSAVSEAQLDAVRIQESCQRVLELKQWCGLFERRAHKPEPISLEEHGMLALKAAMSALRVSSHNDVLPLEQYNQIACFALLSTDEIDPASEFFHYLSQVYEKDTDIAYLNASVSDEQLAHYQHDTRAAECVVFAIFARARAYAGTVGLDERLLHAAKVLAQGRPTVAVLFGNPYIEESLDVDAVVKCFSDSKASRGAACLALSKKSLTL